MLFGINGDLGDSREFLLDWIFDGKDVPRWRIDEVQDGIEGSGFSAAGRPNYDYDSACETAGLFEDAQVLLKKTQSFEVVCDRYLIQQPQNHFLTMLSRNGRHPGIITVSVFGEVGVVTILGMSLHSDILCSQHFQSGKELSG